MDCLPALLRVTTAVLDLGQRAQAGDEDAAARVGELAELLAVPTEAAAGRHRKREMTPG